MKVPYSIRIEKEILDKIRQVANEDGTGVNHEIRQAIRAMLKLREQTKQR